MKSFYLLRNEKESAISVIVIDELKAKYQAVFLTISILDQIKSKQWSNHRSMTLRGNPRIP